MSKRRFRAPGGSLGSSGPNAAAAKMTLRLALVLVLLAALTPTALLAAMSDSELRSVFAEGNQLFREANELSSRKPRRRRRPLSAAFTLYASSGS